MTIGFFSPMPPARTGVADYSAGLVAALRKQAEVLVNPSNRSDYDTAIYQLGNNPLHLPGYREAILHPGIVVLHDAVLHHLLLGSLNERQYVDEFAYNYGEWMRDLGHDLWRSRSRSAADARYFRYPMLRRVTEASQIVVVHNTGAREMVQAAAPQCRVAEIPHYFSPPPLPDHALSTRDRLGIASDEIVIGTFGHLRESKRIGSVLQAVGMVRRARFLLVGRFVSPDLERALAPLLADRRVIHKGYVPEPEFWKLAEIIDICVNLRHPCAGETSGITIRMMGIGKPVLVTSSTENEQFPDLSVIRVDSGEPEVEMLTHFLRLLATDHPLRNEIGRRAALHIAAHHTLEQAVTMYLDVARSAVQLRSALR